MKLEFQVPCGVGVVITKDGPNCSMVLLGKRKGAHGAGKWSLPGGKISPGEHPKECGSREVFEETGIQTHPQRLTVLSTCPHNNTITGGQPWVTLFYWFIWEPTDREPKVMEPHKCEEWRWFNTQKLPSPLFEAFADMAKHEGWAQEEG